MESLTLQVTTPVNCQTHSNNSLATATNCLSVFDHFVGFALKELTADLVQVCSAIVSFLCVEGRLGTTLCMYLILRFSQHFLISWDLKAQVVWQLVRQLIHSVSADNKLLLFLIGRKKTMIKDKNVLVVLWGFLGLLQNILTLKL